jgi:hypothetical protein
VKDEQTDQSNKNEEDEKKCKQPSQIFFSEAKLKHHKVSSYVSLIRSNKTITGPQNSIFTAEEETQDSPNLLEQSYSVSSQLSLSYCTVSTVIATQSNLTMSKLPPGLPGQPVTSKLSYFTNSA